jgi:predicted nucleotidyltransferase
MNRQTTLQLPQTITRFLQDLGGALGDRFVGAIVFGSWATGKASGGSDLDLAVIVADADAERSRREVFHALRVNEVDQRNVSLSVETYLRLKEFIALGDPFAWVVCRQGVVVHDERGRLAVLRHECSERAERFDRQVVAAYLKQKGENHLAHAMQGITQILSNIQLSMMAYAQAAMVSASPGKLAADELVQSADWEVLRTALSKTALSEDELAMVEQLVMAHKRARAKEGFPGCDLASGLESASKAWRRILQQGPTPSAEPTRPPSTDGTPGFGTTLPASGPEA